jgi:hypothetical protein
LKMQNAECKMQNAKQRVEDVTQVLSVSRSTANVSPLDLRDRIEMLVCQIVP